MVRRNSIVRTLGACWLGCSAFLSHSGTAEAPTDRLVVLTSHRPELLQEISSAFRRHYAKEFKREVVIDWIDQGGSYRNANYAMQLAASKAEPSAVDVMWGGGPAPFQKLASLGVFEKLKLDSATKASIGKLKIAADRKAAQDWTWAASSLSSIGLLVNQKRFPSHIQIGDAGGLDLSILADPALRDRVIALDPRASSTFAFAAETLIQKYGWEKGLKILAGVYLNSRSIERRGNDAIESVVKGDAAATVAIDYMSLIKVHDPASTHLKFFQISNVEDLGSDPIAQMKRSSNPQAAQRFVQYILNPEAQKIMQLMKGEIGGPQNHSIGRIAMRPEVFGVAKLANPVNPFVVAERPGRFAAKSLGVGLSGELLAAYVGAVFVDQHARWRDMNEAQRAKALSRIQLLVPSSAEAKLMADSWKLPAKNALILSMAQKRLDQLVADK